MGKEDTMSSGSFDLEKLKDLIELMEKHGVSEVNLRRGDEQWRLRRGPLESPPVAQAPVAAAPPAAAPSAPPAEASPAQPAQAASGLVIKSPTVGTFYSAPSPDDPPFVQVGSKVSAETIVCIVEAMKVFNQIPAEVSGTIVEVLANNGDAVEFGQPLFRVEPV